MTTAWRLGLRCSCAWRAHALPGRRRGNNQRFLQYQAAYIVKTTIEGYIDLVKWVAADAATRDDREQIDQKIKEIRGLFR